MTTSLKSEDRNSIVKLNGNACRVIDIFLKSLNMEKEHK